MYRKSPSKFSLWIIRKLCKPELSEELEGNLLEFYEHTDSNALRGLKYWYQVINYLRPSTLRSFNNSNSGSMFIFNPILTFRNLYRHKATSIISIFGFTFGLVATIFLYFYIQSEVATDQFHANKDQIYRVLRVSEMNGSPYHIGVTSVPYAAALMNDYPADITSTMRLHPEEGLVAVGEKRFNEENLLFADKNFFEFFSFPLISGDKKSVLSTANSAVLTKSAAVKYFGDENPVGKILVLDNEYEFIVSGVMDDYPGNSHIDFSMVFSIALLERFDWFDGWWNNSLMTYVNIPTPQQATNLNEKLDQFMDKYMGEDFKRSGKRVSLELEPLEEVYFNDETRYDFAKHGNFNSILTLGAVALAILFIACFNYVNLSIAQSFMRAKEVGVRKALGVAKSRLVLQFLSESLMILFFSIVMSITICELLSPTFNSFFGLEVELSWLDSNVLFFFVILSTVVLLSSGVYPALLMSSFKSVSVLKGTWISTGKNAGLRKGLVVTQFAISIFLIVASILISIQTDYLNSKDLGFDQEAVVMLDLNNSEIRSQREQFKDRLLANANVLGVTQVSGEPGGFHDASAFVVTGIEGSHRMRTLFTDVEFFNLFNIDIVAGRNYSAEISSDEENTVILNEQAVLELGLTPEEIVGRKVSMPGWDINDALIVGVSANYHFSTLKDEIEPLAILTSGYHRKMAVKVNASSMKEVLLYIDETFAELSPGFPLSYQFLDDKLASLYQKEQQQAKVFKAFSGLSIFLACLGIFGLAAYAAQRRQKELGIRKVLGATAKQIIGLISKEFVLLVLVASFIAIPAAWYFLTQWLGGFAYRISIMDYWFVFLMGGIAAIIIALVTVTLKTYKAAVSDPTESIRSE